MELINRIFNLIDGKDDVEFLGAIADFSVFIGVVGNIWIDDHKKFAKFIQYQS